MQSQQISQPSLSLPPYNSYSQQDKDFFSMDMPPLFPIHDQLIHIRVLFSILKATAINMIILAAVGVFLYGIERRAAAVPAFIRIVVWQAGLLEWKYNHNNLLGLHVASMRPIQ